MGSPKERQRLLEPFKVCCCGWKGEICKQTRADSNIPNVFVPMPDDHMAFLKHGQDLRIPRATK
jgi:hypothetical protein